MDLSVLICAQQAGLVQLGIIVRGGDLNWVASSRHQFEEMGSGWLKLVEAHLQNGTTPRIALHPFVSDFVQTSEEQTFNFHFKTNREGNESMYVFDGFLSKPGCTSYRLLYFSMEISPNVHLHTILFHDISLTSGFWWPFITQSLYWDHVNLSCLTHGCMWTARSNKCFSCKAHKCKIWWLGWVEMFLLALWFDFSSELDCWRWSVGVCVIQL